jgi:NhaP-type Na+/H+ or K+/H+ antiporter
VRLKQLFACIGMIVGLVIKLAPGTIIQGMVQFKQGVFFNLLLPPIILNSGYELKRVWQLHAFFFFDLKI